MNTPMSAFFDELEKIARVHAAVKQFRRSAAGFEDALRSIRSNEFSIAGIPTPARGMASHGKDVKRMDKILEGIENKEGDIVRMIPPSPPGLGANYGPGVYWWRGGFPRDPKYLTSLQDEGFLSRIETLPNKLDPQRNIFAGGVNPHILVTGPHAHRLNSARNKAIAELSAANPDKSIRAIVKEAPPGSLPIPDTTVLDMQTRARNKTLGAAVADAQDAGTRLTDTAIWHLAKSRVTHPEKIPSPNKKQLIEMYKERVKGK